MDARLIALAVALASAATLGCSSSQSCTTEAVAGVSLTVRSGASGAAICDAKITATGTTTATIAPSPGATECGY
ncbi:MAG TPA: hypothetical protein VIF62_26620, partial [Labilithrix sp.]